MNIVQRLGEVQQKAFSQAVEATNAQCQLLSRTRDPREFASAQADLVQEYGQRYVDCANQAIDISGAGVAGVRRWLIEDRQHGHG